MPTPALKPLYEHVLYVNEKKSPYTKTPFNIRGDKYLSPIKEARSPHAVEDVLGKAQDLIILPVHLKEIEETINSSKKILDYKYNWDDNGGVPVNPIIFERATTFLRDYAESIFNVLSKTLRTPDINPVNDGSIDLEWNFENSYFLINFKNTPDEIAFYYGEFKENDKIIFDANGQINTRYVQDQFATHLSHLSN